MKWKGFIVIGFKWVDDKGKLCRKGLRINYNSYRDSEDVGDIIKRCRLEDNIPDTTECYLYGRRVNLEKLESTNAFSYIYGFPEAPFHIFIKEEKAKTCKTIKCVYCGSWLKEREVINGKCPNCTAPITVEDESMIDAALRLWEYK